MSGGPFGLSEDELDDRVATMLDAQRRASSVRVLGAVLRRKILGEFLDDEDPEDDVQRARVLDEGQALQTGDRFRLRRWRERDPLLAGRRR
jgi:hypothetical protein